MGGSIMKKFVSTLCTLGLAFLLAASVKADKLDPIGLWDILPGECYLDGIIAPPHKSIEDMQGFEVPLVAIWSPIKLKKGIQYRGDAKFGVYNFKIGEGKLIKTHIVDVGLNQDDPGLSEEERHNRFIYRCEDVSGSCTATLATVKAAITEQIARDYETEVEDVIYEKNSNANFLGVFVKGMNTFGMRKRDKSGQIYLHTEVCGTNEITMAGATTTF
jgi:hypothetical protein